MADITVLSGAVRYLNGSGQYVAFDAIKGDTGPQGPAGPQGESATGISVNAFIGSSSWTAGTWSSGAVAAGETSGGTCYAHTVTVDGADGKGQFIPSLIRVDSGNLSPIYATVGTDSLLLETATQPAGTVTLKGTVTSEIEETDVVHSATISAYSVSGVGTVTINLRRCRKTVSVTVDIQTNTAVTTGEHHLGTVIPVGYRPHSVEYAMIARHDSGTQGTGVLDIGDDGGIIYGVNVTGVSGVKLVASTTYVVD